MGEFSVRALAELPTIVRSSTEVDMDDERFNRGLSIACCCLSLAMDDLEIAGKKTQSAEALQGIQEIVRNIESCVLILESLQRHRALAGVKIDTLH